LLKRGAQVCAFDPLAALEGLEALSHGIANRNDLERFTLAETSYDATQDADALLVVTEWKTFHHPDFEVLKQRMNNAYILDGRNLYEPQMLQDLGFAYQGIGLSNAQGFFLPDQCAICIRTSRQCLAHFGNRVFK